MANVDVTELLIDPDFVDPFVVTRGTQTVNSKGRTTATPRTFSAVGSVQPAGGRTMNMMPDLVNVNGVIEIWTMSRLEGPSDTTGADVVTWNGRNYVVMTVQSYTNYGAGFVHAICQQLELVAASPNQNLLETGP